MSTPPPSIPGQESGRPLLKLFPVLLINLTAFGIAIPILPALCKSFGGDAVAAALLFTLQALGQFMMAPRWGRLSDRIGRKKVLAITLLLAACVDVATAWSGSLGVLLVVRFIAGIVAGNVATASAYIADVTPLERRSKGMALIGIGFGLGFTFGPAIGAGISYAAPDVPGAFGIGLPFMISAALNIVAFLLAAVWLKEPVQSQEERQSRRELFKGEGLSFGKLLERPGVARLTRFLVGYSVAVTILETTFFYYMFGRYGYDERQVGLIFAGMGLLAALVQGGGVGRLSAKIGDYKMTLYGGVLIGIGLLMATVWQELWFLLPWLAVSAIGRALAQPGALALMSSEAREARESGALMGMVQSANSAGRIIGPLLGGWLFEHVASRAPFVGAGVVMLLSAVFWAVSNTRGNEGLASSKPVNR